MLAIHGFGALQRGRELLIGDAGVIANPFAEFCVLDATAGSIDHAAAQVRLQLLDRLADAGL
jgi:hypothetical protein